VVQKISFGEKEEEKRGQLLARGKIPKKPCQRNEKKLGAKKRVRDLIA